MTEREIAEVLRAVPSEQVHAHCRDGCWLGDDGVISYPDYDAMARAVVERVVTDRDARLARLGEALREAVKFAASDIHATCGDDCLMGAMFNHWRAALADAGAW